MTPRRAIDDRRGSQSDALTLTRRGLLAATATLAGSGLLAGCTADGETTVSILAAGSLQHALTADFDPGPQSVEIEAHGSARAARMVAEGQRDPDILALADPSLFDSMLSTPWYATFATNAVVLAYNPGTDPGSRVADADSWYRPLFGDDIRLGRTDPDLDPLGYRTLFVLDLASEFYDEPDLAGRIVSPDQIYPETQLVAQFDTGAVDAAFVYRSMAIERDYPFRELPDAIDLSDPSRADAYADMSYTMSDGTRVRGAPIRYAATRRSTTDAATAVFDYLVESAADYLEPYGFTVRDSYPTYHGDVPDTID